MLLTIDIGNTNMEFGVFDGERLIANFRLVTKRNITSDEVGLMLLQFLNVHKIDCAAIEDAVIASVVPQVMYSVTNAIKKYIGKNALIVGENLKIDVENRYKNKNEVGCDRLVNAFAAYRLYGGNKNLIVVDFGTATTFDVVDLNGAYLGGLIFPGIKISMEALFTNASKLPRVELNRPKSVIGRDTVSSMQSGAMYGYVGAVENIVDSVNSEIGEKCRVIATGGLSGLINEETDCFDLVDKTLTLKGMRLIYKHNTGR